MRWWQAGVTADRMAEASRERRLPRRSLCRIVTQCFLRMELMVSSPAREKIFQPCTGPFVSLHARLVRLLRLQGGGRCHESAIRRIPSHLHLHHCLSHPSSSS